MTENKKAARARYTLEFEQEAVRLVESGQSIAAAARNVGIAEQTLFNWVKAQRQSRLSGDWGKPGADCSIVVHPITGERQSGSGGTERRQG
jgi:transposase